jgi:hypothetical protein
MTPLMLAAMLMSAEPQKKPVPVQKIDFENDVLEGVGLRPDVDITLVRNPAKFPSLIKVRENFDDKIVRSVDQM